MLTPGQAHDLRAAPFLLQGLKCRDVVADRGYDADALLHMIRARGARAHIPSTSQRVVQRSVSRRIYRKRNLVERFFCKLKHFRRIATRFDKLARNFLAAVALGSTRLWTRVYESTPWPGTGRDNQCLAPRSTANNARHRRAVAHASPRSRTSLSQAAAAGDR